MACVLLLTACGSGNEQPRNEPAPPALVLTPPPKPEPPAAYPVAVSAPAACVLDSYIYVTGGYGHRNEQGGAEFVNRAYRYSPAEKQWERLPDMPIARCFHACAAAEGRIWLFGGLSQGGADSITQVDCYDPESRKWTTPTNLPTPRNRLAAAAIGPRLYVVGGMDLQDSAAVEIFDASTVKWSDGPALPVPRHGHTIAVAGGKLLVIGGSGTGEITTTLEDGKWVDLAKLPGLRLFSSAATVDQHVFLAGNRMVGDVPLLRYDTGANKWDVVAEKSVNLCRAAAAALGGKLYVICGEDQNGAELSRVSVYDPGNSTWMHSH